MRCKPPSDARFTSSGDLCRPAPRSLAWSSPFEHHAQQRLGPRVAHEQPAVAAERGLDARHRGGDLGTVARSVFSRTRTLTSTCGYVTRSRQVGQLASGLGHDAQHTQRRGDPVAGKQVIGKDDVPRLLAAERQIARAASPPSRTCRRPGCAPSRCRARAARSRARCCSSRWRRRRCPAAGPRPSAACPHISRTASPSTIVPACIDEDRAVAVAVERDTQPASAVTHRAARGSRDASIRSRD